MTRSLKGIRLVVTGFELEQQEHRGIAVFTKGLLRALKGAGAEIWLLTEIQPSTHDIKKAQLPKAVQERVNASRVLDILNSGETKDPNKNPIYQLVSQLPLLKYAARTLHMIYKRKKEIKNQFFPRKRIKKNHLKLIPSAALIGSPYERCERLSYLREIDGLICARDCFTNSFSLARRASQQELQIDIQGFDGLITTSPLNIKPLNTNLFIQTIHDLIPLDYQRTRDHLPSFTRRLQAAGHAKRIFVSEDARRNYEHCFSDDPSKKTNSECVVSQSPSLHFPGDCLDWEARIEKIQILSNDQKLHSLEPCSYFLFNSSIVPHKNLLFALKAFMESGLEHKNIHFCITGKLQNDPYSKLIESTVQKHKSVIFTGYVDEATKRQLYLNALALLSPSLVEGFGIPVLDAACLGLSTIASPLGSHREIQAMNDFADHVLLCSTLITSDWASAMRLVALKHNHEFSVLSEQSQKNKLNQMRADRIQRYRRYQTLIDKAFQKSICELITS